MFLTGITRVYYKLLYFINDQKKIQTRQIRL